MKKLLLICCFLLAPLGLSAQTYVYRAYELAYKTYNYRYRTWSNWSNWESCDVMVTIDMGKDRIIIYSKETQVYQVFDSSGSYNDRGGGYTYEYKCLDANRSQCDIRLRVAPDKTAQLYVDYADATWVYDIYLQY